MDNETKSPGELISEIVLIDGYSLVLRYNQIRTCINSRLKELVVNGIHSQVEVDQCDRLTIAFYVDKDQKDILVPFENGIDDNKIRDGVKNKKETFVENINKAFNSINLIILKSMKNDKKGVTPSVTENERERIAQDVTKMIKLCQSENGSILKKVGFDISEACRKLTNGVIDTVFVEDGIFSFISSDKGLNMSFNSVGHSDVEITHVVAAFINSMMELSKVVMPLVGSTVVTQSGEDKIVESKQNVMSARTKQVAKSAKDKMGVQVPKGKSREAQIEEYNRLIEEKLNSIDMDDKIGKRAFSQQIRGKMLHCANEAKLIVAGGTSIEELVKRMTFENIQSVVALYDLCNQEIPGWLVKLSDEGEIKK